MKLQYFGLLLQRTDSVEKTLMLGKDWRQKEKGTTQVEVVGWHHQLNGQLNGVWASSGSWWWTGKPVCCHPRGHKQSGMTETNWLKLRKQKETQRLRERIYDCWREGIVREFGMDMYTLLYLKWVTNKDLLYSKWTLLNVVWQPGWEGSLWKNSYVCLYGWVLSLFTWDSHSIVG